MRNYVTAALITLLLILSFPIKSAVIKDATHEKELAETALKVNSTKQFNYILNTEQGNLITDGTFTAKDSVKFPEMKAGYTSVTKTRQEYTEHIRTTVDSKGHTHTHVYWSWDTVSSETKHNKILTYRKHSFPSQKFDSTFKHSRISAAKILAHPSSNMFKNNDYYYISSNVRYYYKVTPLRFHAGFIASAGEHGLVPIEHEQNIKLHDESTKEITASCINSVQTSLIFFYILYIGLSLGACIITYQVLS